MEIYLGLFSIPICFSSQKLQWSVPGCAIQYLIFNISQSQIHFMADFNLYQKTSSRCYIESKPFGKEIHV